MHIDAHLTARGIAVHLDGEVSTAVPYEIRFPEEIWHPYSGKDFLLNEIAYVATLAVPMLVESPRVTYATARPRFYKLYNYSFEQSIPNMTEEIPEENPRSITRRWRDMKRDFAGREGKRRQARNKTNRRMCVIPFSFGKDSLLSLGLLLRLGCRVIPVMINEFMLPRAWKMKQSKSPELYRATGLKTRRVENEIQLLSDFEVLGMPRTRLYQVQAHFMYLLAMLPFCEFYGSPSIILNNELMNSLPFVHRCGITAPRRFMQSRHATAIMRSIATLSTGGAVSVHNLIGGLGDFAIHYLLHEHFTDLSKLRTSCHMELTRHDRWCHGCERCARAYLFSLALGEDPGAMGFRHSLATGESMKHFNAIAPPGRGDAYREFAGEEERLACTMAHQRGHRDELIMTLHRNRAPLPAHHLRSTTGRVFGIHERRPLRSIHGNSRSMMQHLLEQVQNTLF
ncbi:MAG: hypothetical protein JXA20_10895 [Spirochaetes bacterium]|nr:hypothetical protein [Spirochaetota bacterium]